ncbi:MAG: hypothetical protein CL688_02375 [Candidatus Puniceispirillum sp.]|nr:hypothetical protein [Candidatus Puniceispirillum sp.]
MAGSKSVLALTPTSICFYFATRPDTGPLTPADFVIPMAGALNTPVASKLMCFVRIDVYPKSTGVVSWQRLFLPDFLARLSILFSQPCFLRAGF